MNDHPADGVAVGKGRRSRVGRKGFILLTALFFIWIGLRIRDNLNGDDPIRRIRSGNLAERRQAALDLRSGAPGWPVEDVVAALVRSFEDPDAGVRAMAAQSLGVLVSEHQGLSGDAPRAQENLEKNRDAATHTFARALSDQDANVRAVAAAGLGLIGKRSPLMPRPELIAAVKDASATVRAAAVRSLSNFTRGDDSMIPGFLSMLENDEPEVRRACVEVLGTARPTPALVPALIDTLRSHDRQVRFYSARLLGRIGAEAKAAIPSLILVLKEPIDPEIAQTKVLTTEWDPSGSAAIALGQIAASEEVIAALSETLSSGIPERRLSAAEALGRIGPRAAPVSPALIGALKELLDSQEERPGAYTMAVALGRIAPNSASAQDAVITLMRVLGSSRYRLASVGAAEALGKFGRDAASAVPKLRALAADPSSAKDPHHTVMEALDAIERASRPVGVISPAR
jgi:HEAT repeat protein